MTLAAPATKERALATCFSAYQYLTVGGHRLAYRTAGATSGKPVMLIHAFASQSGSWEDVAQTLADEGFRVVAPDLRGHGRSARTATYALSEFEQDLVALLDALDLHDVSLVGHSLGAHLALRLAAHQPGRIRKLVLEAAPVPPRDTAETAGMAASRPGPAWRHSLKLLGMGRLIRLLLLRQFDLRAALSVPRELRTPMPAWWNRLTTLSSPCLLLAGHDDGAVTQRLSLLSSHLPNATAHHVGSGHRLHGEHTEAFLAAVLPFLSA